MRRAVSGQPAAANGVGDGATEGAGVGFDRGTVGAGVTVIVGDGGGDAFTEREADGVADGCGEGDGVVAHDATTNPARSRMPADRCMPCASKS